MLKKLDEFLNSITMYRLVVYLLFTVGGYALVLSLFDILNFGPLEIVVSFLILYFVCLGANYLFAKLFDVMTNSESATITSLILFLILEPSLKLEDVKILILTAILAMASKYVLAINQKHIFNPSAVALVFIGLLGFGNSIWWVATPAMLPVVLLGLLVVRKIRKAHLFLSFLLFSLGTILFNALVKDQNLSELLPQIFMSWPLIFFGCIMLTEPLTSPVQRGSQIVYGSLVGVLFGLQFHFGRLFSTPELSLVIGNIFAYLISQNDRQKITLIERLQLTPTIFEFVFAPSKKTRYKSGQYAELTLGHADPDSRGNRRYFTIASSPLENELRFGIRIRQEASSSFKRALLNITKGEEFSLTQIGGDFTLPDSKAEKLVFIASGVGITPFSSMTRRLLDVHEDRNIVLIYILKNRTDYAYKDLFEEAKKKLGMKVYVWERDNEGEIEKEDLVKMVPDFKQRIFYISGPNFVVEQFKSLLQTVRVVNKRINTDYFPGY